MPRFILFLVTIIMLYSTLTTRVYAQNQPYTSSPGEMISVGGMPILKDLVFRFMPVTLPLASLRISSLYGMRLNPFTHSSTEFHPGVDFADHIGAQVYATAAGVVTWTGNRGAYGTMIEVRHGLGFSTRYSHLSAINVVLGQTVDRNAVLGEVGSTGRSTGPHLYYEIWHNGERMDPIRFIIAAYELYHHLL
jgi:murein DD-endopeptidase MepM/ murein hydrolase activator NlpD